MDKEVESNKPGEESNDKMLTPWQKANMTYLKEKGKKPTWLKKTETEAADEAVEQTQGEVTQAPTNTWKNLPKKISFADKLPKLKTYRQKQLRKKLFPVFLVFGLGVIISLYYISPLSRLDTVVVAGNATVPKEAIVQATSLKKNMDFWQARLDQDIPTEIKQELPRIKSVKVSTTHLNSVKLTVEEYDEVAYVKTKQGYQLVLEDGTLERSVINDQKLNQTYPILIGFKSNKMRVKLIQMYNQISPSIQKKIKEIHYTPTKKNQEKITLYMKDDNQVIGSIFDLNDKIGYYPEVVKEMEKNGDIPGVVDMIVGIYSYSLETKEKEELEKKEADKEKEDNEAVQPTLEDTNELNDLNP